MSAPLRLRTFDADARPPQDGDEVVQRPLRQPAIGQAGHVVERDQVDVRLPAAQQPGQLGRVLAAGRSGRAAARTRTSPAGRSCA